MTDDESWPSGTVGHLARPLAALITALAVAVIALVFAAAVVAVLLVLRVLT